MRVLGDTVTQCAKAIVLDKVALGSILVPLAACLPPLFPLSARQFTFYYKLLLHSTFRQVYNDMTCIF